MNQIHIDECPICRQGILIVMKEEESNNYLLICDDCESQWLNPEAVMQGAPPLELERNKLKEASIEEVKEIGWMQYVKKPFF